jgi:hypothetical protein
MSALTESVVILTAALEKSAPTDNATANLDLLPHLQY